MKPPQILNRLLAGSLGLAGALIVVNGVSWALGLFVMHALPSYLSHILQTSPQWRLVYVAVTLPIQLMLVRVLSKKGHHDLAMAWLLAALFFGASKLLIALALLIG